MAFPTTIKIRHFGTFEQVKVVNPDNEVVPIGETGELCTRGYGTMLNYWNDPAKTEEVMKENGWYHTGYE